MIKIGVGGSVNQKIKKKTGLIKAVIALKIDLGGKDFVIQHFASLKDPSGPQSPIKITLKSQVL